jgi:hypothetical protein
LAERDKDAMSDAERPVFACLKDQTMTIENEFRNTLQSLPRGSPMSMSADQFREITGEDLDEFTPQRALLMIQAIATETGCELRREESRIIFTKR